MALLLSGATRQRGRRVAMRRPYSLKGVPVDSKIKDALQQASISAKGRYARGNAGLVSERAKRRMEEAEHRAARKREKRRKN